jgi:hypothetical protein
MGCFFQDVFLMLMEKRLGKTSGKRLEKPVVKRPIERCLRHPHESGTPDAGIIQ